MPNMNNNYPGPTGWALKHDEVWKNGVPFDSMIRPADPNDLDRRLAAAGTAGPVVVAGVLPDIKQDFELVYS